MIEESVSEESEVELEKTALTNDGEGEEAGKDAGGDASEKASETDHDTKEDKSEDGKADKDSQPEGARSEYKFDIPENVVVDEEILSEFTPLLKDLGASQEQAQKIVDLQTKFMEQQVKAQQTAWTEQESEWSKAAENDKEYGKGNYDKSILVARQAMREIGGAELSKALEETRMGNHPEFIRFFYRVGLAIGEDSLSFGQANKEGAKSIAQRMFRDQG